jgi:tetratricopeptide (TPR) repeat protein
MALSLDPDDKTALIERSRANSGLSDFARAYADADRAAALAPDSASAFTARAAAAFGLKHYLQAVEDARRALALDPNDRVAFQLMKLSEGRTSPRRDFEKDDTRIAGAVEREYHGMVQQLDQAEERRLTPPAEPSPAAVSRLVADAGAKLAVKDYWGAIRASDQALALAPDNARALYFRAAAHNLIGEYGDAARDATRGLTVKPDDDALLDARSWAFNRMGRYRDAVADAHTAMAINPADAYAFANRAYAYEQNGDFHSMLKDYRTAAQLNPQFEPTYRDAALRHGLAPKALPGEPAEAPAAPAPSRRSRQFLAVLLSSLLGGLLVALGIMHVGSGLKESRSATPPRLAGLEAEYEIGRPIGQGGMGVVYEAFDRRLQRHVAIKMLRDEFKLDDSAKAGFIEEARTVAELHHPSIVDIHNIVEDERGLYLVFERLEGRTLDEVISEKGRLPLSEIKRILKPVCDALEYAHARDVVHRDLKPSNIMLQVGGAVKVLDFGISRHASRAVAKAVTQTVVGTPHYMAPEQEYGFVQRENDVFSLGALFYEMVVGARPYEGSHQAKLAKGYRRASTRVEGLRLEVDALIEASLEPDPEKRLKSPGEFWRRLAAIPDGPRAA